MNAAMSRAASHIGIADHEPRETTEVAPSVFVELRDLGDGTYTLWVQGAEKREVPKAHHDLLKSILKAGRYRRCPIDEETWILTEQQLEDVGEALRIAKRNRTHNPELQAEALRLIAFGSKGQMLAWLRDNAPELNLESGPNTVSDLRVWIARIASAAPTA